MHVLGYIPTTPCTGHRQRSGPAIFATGTGNRSPIINLSAEGHPPLRLLGLSGRGSWQRVMSWCGGSAGITIMPVKAPHPLTWAGKYASFMLQALSLSNQCARACDAVPFVSRVIQPLEITPTIISGRYVIKQPSTSASYYQRDRP